MDYTYSTEIQNKKTTAPFQERSFYFQQVKRLLASLGFARAYLPFEKISVFGVDEVDL